MFLSILAHHKKNIVVKFDYQRFGQTVSHYVHIMLKAVLGIWIFLFCDVVLLFTVICNLEHSLFFASLYICFIIIICLAH
ncbi:hypothetical protein ACS0TY_030555 [Phlomoides rotata]